MHKLGASVLALMLLVSVIAYIYLMVAWGKLDDKDDSAYNQYITSSRLIFLILASYTLCSVVIFVECVYKKKCNLCIGVMLFSLLVLQGLILGSHGMAYRQVTLYNVDKHLVFQTESLLITLYSMILGNILFISFLCVYCCLCGRDMGSGVLRKTIL